MVEFARMDAASLLEETEKAVSSYYYTPAYLVNVCVHMDLESVCFNF